MKAAARARARYLQSKTLVDGSRRHKDISTFRIEPGEIEPAKWPIDGSLPEEFPVWQRGIIVFAVRDLRAWYSKVTTSASRVRIDCRSTHRADIISVLPDELY
jgi:hypothetical protein